MISGEIYFPLITKHESYHFCYILNIQLFMYGLSEFLDCGLSVVAALATILAVPLVSADRPMLGWSASGRYVPSA